MTATERARVPGRAWRALAVASAGYVLFGFNSTATNLAFGSIAETFSDANETTVSLVASGYFIASAAFLPLGGRLADRVGRRRIFNLGLLGFIVTAAASAMAPTIEILIAARVGQAVAGAFVIPSSLAAILPEFPAARRPSAVATWAAAGPLSAAIAPSAAAAMLEATTWRWVYFLSVPIATITLVLSYLAVSESKGDGDSTERLDLAGSVLAVAGVALLILGIGQGSNWGWADVRTTGAIVASLVFGSLFVARSRRHPAPLVNIGLFRVPEIAIANLANFFMSLTSLSIWLIWPLFLGRIWGYPIGRIGLAITIGPLFAGPAALLGGRLADRYGQRWLMIVGSAICTAAVTWSIFSLGSEPNYLIDFMPTVAGFGLGWGLSNPSMNSWALAHGPQAFYGEINAAFNTLRNLAAAIGTAVAIAIIGSANRPDALAAYAKANTFFASAVGLCFLTVAIGSTWLARRKPATLAEPAASADVTRGAPAPAPTVPDSPHGDPADPPPDALPIAAEPTSPRPRPPHQPVAAAPAPAAHHGPAAHGPAGWRPRDPIPSAPMAQADSAVPMVPADRPPTRRPIPPSVFQSDPAGPPDASPAEANGRHRHTTAGEPASSATDRTEGPGPHPHATSEPGRAADRPAPAPGRRPRPASERTRSGNGTADVAGGRQQGRQIAGAKDLHRVLGTGRTGRSVEGEDGDGDGRASADADRPDDRIAEADGDADRGADRRPNATAAGRRPNVTAGGSTRTRAMAMASAVGATVVGGVLIAATIYTRARRSQSGGAG